jgi:hypothetical protein
VVARWHTRVARSLARSARARIGWPFVREMMIGALLGALMVFTMGGRAEASCSGCSSHQYCKYGSIYDSCESCPSLRGVAGYSCGSTNCEWRCTGCGSKTSPVHGSGTCPGLEPPPPPPQCTAEEGRCTSGTCSCISPLVKTQHTSGSDSHVCYACSSPTFDYTFWP